MPVVCIVLLVAVRTRTVIVPPAYDVMSVATMPTWSARPSPSMSPDATTRQPLTPLHTVVEAAEAGVAKASPIASAADTNHAAAPAAMRFTYMDVPCSPDLVLSRCHINIVDHLRRLEDGCDGILPSANATTHDLKLSLTTTAVAFGQGGIDMETVAWTANTTRHGCYQLL